MPLAEFTALLLLATAMSFTPGPNTMLAAALGANRGLPATLRFVLAVPIGWSALLLIGTAGLGAAVTAIPLLGWIMRAAGIAYLLWLAWRLAHPSHLAQAGAAPLLVGFWEGVLLQFVNIKAWLAVLTIVANWLVGRDNVGQRLALMLPVLAVFAFASNLTYAAFGALLRRWLTHGQRLLWFNRSMAAMLATTAMWMGFM